MIEMPECSFSKKPKMRAPVSSSRQLTQMHAEEGENEVSESVSGERKSTTEVVVHQASLAHFPPS